MKKRLNGKTSKIKKRILGMIIILIFLFYICLVLAVSNRPYLHIESFFKSISSCISGFFIDNAYSSNGSYFNVINSKIKYLENENNELKKTLSLKETNINYVPCTIINHNSKVWFDKITINAGYDKNISNELPVINDAGLIGFISKTGKKVSEVKLLTSINDDSLISVIIETSSRSIAGILSDYDIKKGLFKITDVTSKADIYAGDSVVLSGYGNEAYKGIYVGCVIKEESDNYGLSRTIWVKSNVNFDDLLFVLVPTYKEEK